jgi:ferrous iron transport protein B
MTETPNDCHGAPTPRPDRTGRRLIAIAGNPNTGKTTLFNRLTGANARVGNYPGITVERTLGQLALAGETFDVLDVPGTYSLVSRSPEEQIAIDALLGRHGHPRPDLVVLVLDATNLGRNLYMVLQVLEFGLPLILALNMMDAAVGAGLHIDVGALERRLGIPVVPTTASKAHGLDALRTQIADALDDDPLYPPPGWRWTPTPALEADLTALVPHLGSERPDDLGVDATRAVSLWALMSIDADDELEGVPAGLRLAVLDRLKQAREAGRDPDAEAVAARYAWIDKLVAEVMHRDPPPGRSWTERFDAVLIHPVAGFAVFMALMFVVFQALFAWSDPAITAIETLFGAAGDALRGAMAPGMMSDFLVDGLIGGVGSVIVFLPQIILLFLFIGLLEDSGYMARAAFLMDRVMNKVGLHGRAFVPMLSGFACAVPAIMATRTMERRRDRFLTMMVVPLTTCSARLPVYTLIIGSLFPTGDVLGLPVAGLLMIAMYLFGTLMALIAAAVIGRTVLKGPRVPLLMELPPYRAPDPRSVARLLLGRVKLFLTEAGTVILACSIILWGLLYFPRTSPEADAIVARIAALPAEDAADADARAALEAELAGARLRNSLGGRLGQLIEPAIEPLGFDWKIGVGLIGAFAAREVFVSTLGVVYGVGGDVDEESATLRERMRAERHADGRPVYSPLAGLSLLVFFALAAQCMSTLAAVKRETRSWRWPTFVFGYMTALAWGGSFLVWQVGRALGF